MACRRRGDAGSDRRRAPALETVGACQSWTTHLRIACFDGLDLPAWTIEHPYGNPLEGIADSGYDSNPQSEIINPKSVSLQWVRLEDSIQWHSFRQAVGLLKERRNKVFVLVGPFNEHMLDAEDAATYDRIKKTIDEWLTASGVPHWMAPALPASLYADLSHPVADGDASLARQLLNEPAFKMLLGSPSDR
jgi:hypothetical protein